jgi:3-hydroxyacyl-[acyl-carrier-protein] dehydratase|tara:strand:+ start:156 stop:590 length:435 start_codon:yes stop_codon:yes gene_type:complete
MKLNLPITNLADIKKLIPHREPIIMVDGLLDFQDGIAQTTLKILESNIFVNHGFFTENGMIEHMAQSVALYTGFKNHNLNAPPKEGFIASIKFFKLEQLPLVGKTITTKVHLTYESEQISMVNFTSYGDNTVLATAEMSTVLKQ